MKILKDSFGRTFPYIRLSITDVCNFKCGYCLPNGYQKDKSDNRTFLTYEEIGRLAKGCLLYTSPSPRDLSTSRMPSSA